MKPRIEYLFKRAGGKSSVHNLMSNPMQQRIYHELWDDNIQKFAELIIKECHEVIVVGGVDDLDGVMKHFEIE
jgi:hypothetical protein